MSEISEPENNLLKTVRGELMAFAIAIMSAGLTFIAIVFGAILYNGFPDLDEEDENYDENKNVARVMAIVFIVGTSFIIYGVILTHRINKNRKLALLQELLDKIADEYSRPQAEYSIPISYTGEDVEKLEKVNNTLVEKIRKVLNEYPIKMKKVKYINRNGMLQSGVGFHNYGCPFTSLKLEPQTGETYESLRIYYRIDDGNWKELKYITHRMRKHQGSWVPSLLSEDFALNEGVFPEHNTVEWRWKFEMKHRTCIFSNKFEKWEHGRRWKLADAGECSKFIIISKQFGYVRLKPKDDINDFSKRRGWWIFSWNEFNRRDTDDVLNEWD